MIQILSTVFDECPICVNIKVHTELYFKDKTLPLKYFFLHRYSMMDLNNEKTSNFYSHLFRDLKLKQHRVNNLLNDDHGETDGGRASTESGISSNCSVSSETSKSDCSADDSGKGCSAGETSDCSMKVEDDAHAQNLFDEFTKQVQCNSLQSLDKLGSLCDEKSPSSAANVMSQQNLVRPSVFQSSGFSMNFIPVVASLPGADGEMTQSVVSFPVLNWPCPTTTRENKLQEQTSVSTDKSAIDISMGAIDEKLKSSVNLNMLSDMSFFKKLAVTNLVPVAPGMSPILSNRKNESTMNMVNTTEDLIKTKLLCGKKDKSINIDEDNQPMICAICDDRATGLHYGIITCEG